MNNSDHDGSKQVKNIAAVIYLLVMIFVVGGSYWHQQDGGKTDGIAMQSQK